MMSLYRLPLEQTIKRCCICSKPLQFYDLCMQGKTYYVYMARDGMYIEVEATRIRGIAMLRLSQLLDGNLNSKDHKTLGEERVD